MDKNFMFNKENTYNQELAQVFSESEFSCQRSCFKDEKCKLWTWSSVKKQCYLNLDNALGKRELNSSYVSGTANCPGNCFLIKIFQQHKL